MLDSKTNNKGFSFKEKVKTLKVQTTSVIKNVSRATSHHERRIRKQKHLIVSLLNQLPEQTKIYK